MTRQNKIQPFEQKKVRTVWDEEQEKWFFSIIEVIEVLTDSPRPRKYWNALKTKLQKEVSGGCVKMLAQPLFLCAKPRLSQARALLLPKVFVTLGINFSLWQSYIFVLTFPTKPFFFLGGLMKT